MDAAARIPSDLHPFDRKALIARPAGKAEKLFGEASNFATAFTAEEKRHIKKTKTFLPELQFLSDPGKPGVR